jgi:hypothetical protein
MPALDCSHEDIASVHRVCPHLPGVMDGNYFRYFSGQGRLYHLTCKICSDLSFDAIRWRTVCDSCLADIMEKYDWAGIYGEPSILEEAISLRFLHRRFGSLGEELRGVVPVPSSPGSVWIGITASGSLIEYSFHAQERVTLQEIVHLKQLPEAFEIDTAINADVSLICSADGRFLCVGETLNDRCVVYDRQTSRFTLQVQSSNYRSGEAPFSMAFVQEREHTLLIHKTAWNRLDISDPATGALLTTRTFEENAQDKSRSPHYFHGQLAVAPDQDYIADASWILGDIGILLTWSGRRWRTENAWEFENGPTKQKLTLRWYFWNAPMCWIDNRTLAVWGYGEDEQSMLPAVCLYDGTSGKLKDWFPGPEKGPLYFDRYLFSASPQHGLSVWNVETGARLHEDKSFSPIAYHPTTKEFFSVLANGTLQLSRLLDA